MKAQFRQTVFKRRRLWLCCLLKLACASVKTGREGLGEPQEALFALVSGSEEVMKSSRLAPVRHLDGKSLDIQGDARVVRPGEVLLVPGCGMPKPGGFGDLLVRFEVDFPKAPRLDGMEVMARSCQQRPKGRL